MVLNCSHLLDGCNLKTQNNQQENLTCYHRSVEIKQISLLSPTEKTDKFIKGLKFRRGFQHLFAEKVELIENYRDLRCDIVTIKTFPFTKLGDPPNSG